MGFEWWTGEKDSVREEGAPAANGDGPPPWRTGWPWVLVLGLLLLAGAATFFLWRRGQEEMAEATSAVTADVLSSYNLAQRAAADRDDELLVTVLSGRDPQWTKAQRQLLQQGPFFGEAARFLGLHPLSQPTVADVSLSPDFREARLLATQRYSVTLIPGLTRTVALSQTLVFRRGRQRWFYAPPDEAFWGNRVTIHERRLSLTYPRRDRDAVVSLGSDLNRALEEMCATSWVSCPPGPVADVRLATEPQSLLRLAEPDAMLEVGDEIILPTLSLVGWPTGEIAHQALSRGYASFVLAATAGDLMGYRCCEKALFHQALLDRLLSDLGVRLWPLSPDDYLRFADEPVPMGRMDDFWRSAGVGRPPTAHERQQARAFVSFLEAAYDVWPEEQHRLLLEAEGFWGWMRAMSGVAVGQEEMIGHDWRRFLYAQANAGQGPPPAVLDRQALRLVCQSESGSPGLYHLEPASRQWTLLEGLDGEVPALFPLAGDRGIILYDRIGASAEALRPQLWIGQREIRLSPSWRPATQLLPDPGGRYLTMRSSVEQDGSVDEVALLDVDSCEESECRFVALPGFPFWSPSGSQLLLWSSRGQRLLHGTREEMRWRPLGVERAGRPFWFDEETYGYVRGARRIEMRSVSSDTDQEPGLLVSLEELLAALPGEQDPRAWSILAVVPSPAVAHTFLVMLVARPGLRSRQLFLFRSAEAAAGRALIPLYFFSELAFSDPGTFFSPAGRWLALTPSAGFGQGVRLLVHDLERDETALVLDDSDFVPLRTHDWSLDGLMLARIGRRLIEVLVFDEQRPETLYRHFVYNEALQCTAVAWVNR